MGRSQETFGKKEREKKRLKKAQEKRERKEDKKASPKKSGLDDMIAYVDEYGRISSTPPDPTKREKINSEDIEIGVPRKEDREEEETIRQGVVTFFNESKGYGFIKDLNSQESVFVHINALSGPVAERDKVTFEVEHTPKGLSAVNVKPLE